MRRFNYWVRCPGCSKRLHGPTEEALRRQMDRHAHNCGPLRQLAAHAPKTPEAQFAATPEAAK